MKFKVFNNASNFEQNINPVLLEKEDVFSLLWSVINDIKAGKYENSFMATVEREGKVLALFLIMPPQTLIPVFADENRLEEIMDFSIKKMNEFDIDFNSIISLKPWAYSLASKCGYKASMTYRLLLDQGVYRLNKVNNMLPHSPGTWRYAEEYDSSLIEKWYNLFESDTGMPISPIEQVQKSIKMYLDNREILLWIDQGEIVSMMRKSTPAKNGVTVGMVYTPKEKRKKGYARTLVATISEELLKEYDFCVLYTDLMNPTSNKIYRKIGYEKIAETVHLNLASGK